VLLVRTPRPSLRPFVRTVWATDAAGTTPPAADRETVLPTGTMHLAIRLSGPPFAFFDQPGARIGRALGYAVVGGARAGPYWRDVSGPSSSLGAQLQPGACRPLLAVLADELAGRHTPLESLWGRTVDEMRDRLREPESLQAKLDLFESILADRLPRVHGLHPAVAQALESFTRTDAVREVVRLTGYSHRGFIRRFHEAVGLTPKLYCRVQRFQRLLARIAADPDVPWAESALDAGYCDQQHLNREFRMFAGLTPGEYRASSPTRPHHVPVRRPRRQGVNSVQDRVRRSW